MVTLPLYVSFQSLAHVQSQKQATQAVGVADIDRSPCGTTKGDADKKGSILYADLSTKYCFDLTDFISTARVGAL